MSNVRASMLLNARTVSLALITRRVTVGPDSWPSWTLRPSCSNINVTTHFAARTWSCKFAFLRRMHPYLAHVSSSCLIAATTSSQCFCTLSVVSKVSPRCASPCGPNCSIDEDTQVLTCTWEQRLSLPACPSLLVGKLSNVHHVTELEMLILPCDSRHRGIGLIHELRPVSCCFIGDRMTPSQVGLSFFELGYQVFVKFVAPRQCSGCRSRRLMPPSQCPDESSRRNSSTWIGRCGPRHHMRSLIV